MSQDSAARLGQVIRQHTDELQELRRQLGSREREVRELSREKEQQGWDPHLEINRLQSQLQEKEAFIQVSVTELHVLHRAIAATPFTQNYTCYTEL